MLAIDLRAYPAFGWWFLNRLLFWCAVIAVSIFLLFCSGHHRCGRGCVPDRGLGFDHRDRAPCRSCPLHRLSPMWRRQTLEPL